MILRVILFFSCIILVSSNTGVIIPQTLPIYQQNVYPNPTGNLPNDITPYLQGMTAQNHLPSLNLSPSNVREMLLNRILLNTPVQAVLDQNVRGYGSNLIEYPGNSVPLNDVSNYFAAPVSEYVNNQANSAINNGNTPELKTKGKRKKSHKRRSSKSRRKLDEVEESDKNSRKNNKNNDTRESNRKTSRKSRKRSRKQNSEIKSKDNETTSNEYEGNRKSKSKKRKNKREHEPNVDEDEVKDPKPRRRHKKKSKSDKNTEKAASEQPTTLKTATSDISEGINLANFYEGVIQENRITRNLQKESNEPPKSTLTLPDNYPTNFNFQGLPQFENNPVMSNFMANYQKMYQSMLANTKNERVIVTKNKPNKTKNDQRKAIVTNNKNSTSPATTKPPPVTPKVNIVTTEKSININEKTRTNVDSKSKQQDSKPNKPPEVVETTTKTFNKEEVSDEIINPESIDANDNRSFDKNEGFYLSNRYIDDYYPLFHDSAAYNANNREVFVKHSGDTKYYYATDRGNSDITRMRFENFKLPEKVPKNYEIKKQYKEIEKESIRNVLETDFEEETQFKSPPHLETPDFETRKVERAEINPEPYYYYYENDNFNPVFDGHKASIYSNAKTQHYTGTKENGKKAQKDKLNKDVETVFARSKVVKYGPVYNPDEDLETVTEIENSTDFNYYKDGDTTYVLATSLDHPEQYR